MGHMLAGVAFDSTISVEMAHQISKIAEQLTYRQLCILKLCANNSAFALKEGDYRKHGSFSKELYQVLYECLDLYTRGFISFGGSVAFGPTDVKPSDMKIQGLGADLYNLMQLWAIPNEDLILISRILKP